MIFASTTGTSSRVLGNKAFGNIRPFSAITITRAAELASLSPAIRRGYRVLGSRVLRNSIIARAELASLSPAIRRGYRVLRNRVFR